MSQCFKIHISFLVKFAVAVGILALSIFSVALTPRCPLNKRRTLELSWLPVTRWPITLECWTPPVTRACFRGDPPLSAHARCTLATKNMLSKLRTTSCKCVRTLPTLPLLVLWINGTFSLSKDAAPLLGDCEHCRDYAAIQTHAGSIQEFIHQKRSQTQNQGRTVAITKRTCLAGEGTKSDVQKMRVFSSELDMSQCWILWIAMTTAASPPFGSYKATF